MSYTLNSLKGDFLGDYIGTTMRAVGGGYWEFRLSLG